MGNHWQRPSNLEPEQPVDPAIVCETPSGHSSMVAKGTTTESSLRQASNCTHYVSNRRHLKGTWKILWISSKSCQLCFCFSDNGHNLIRERTWETRESPMLPKWTTSDPSVDLHIGRYVGGASVVGFKRAYHRRVRTANCNRSPLEFGDPAQKEPSWSSLTFWVSS